MSFLVLMILLRIKGGQRYDLLYSGAITQSASISSDHYADVWEFSKKGLNEGLWSTGVSEGWKVKEWCDQVVAKIYNRMSYWRAFGRNSCITVYLYIMYVL